jgi:hypothetical protein
MHTHMLRAALAALVVLLPVRSEAQASARTGPTHAQNAEAVVGELLSHRQALALTGGQIDRWLGAPSSRFADFA